MSDQTNGLRFDVYERVHLPEDVAAIDELEEIELIPRIAVIDEGEQAILRGQLLLNGVYRGQEEQDGLLVLEHRIPVEISLPMSRVSRLDDISIDIDNFDVDILSARTLNITGVLSLKGLLVESLDEEENNWSEEVYTAVHERADEVQLHAQQFESSQYQPHFSSYIVQEDEEEISYDRSSDEDEEAEAEYAADHAYDSEEDAEQEQEEEEEEERPEEQLDEQWDNIAASDSDEEEWEQETVELAADDREEAAENWQTEEQAKWQAQWQAEQLSYQASAAVLRDPENAEQNEEIYEDSDLAEEEEERPQYTAVEQEASFEQLEDTAEETELSFAHNEAVVPREEAAPEKQSLQIAFNAKPVSESGEEQSGLGISSLLQSSKRESAARKAAVQSDIEAVAEEQERTEEQEEVEWKKMFLNKSASDQSFKKIRLCIVQREETLEQIALRYSLNPREILQHNRLSEPSVSEGQIIYIPS
ncbi:LysM peptidoglycan-binding domain-containing protein [Paenibacillus sp. GXUN7292]|uniref:LysM peptidoglycan-binding domain-containing protein n=1 Tax=Paenibacillus sp. GXUN7292 TaxID=3422499 RepID=UPI003D7E312E